LHLIGFYYKSKNLWSYLAQFFLNEKCFRQKLQRKLKHTFDGSPLPPKLCCLWDNVEKYGTARQATDDNIIWHMCIACWITKATNTHSKYVILIAFPLWQELHKRALMLHYMYTSYLFFFVCLAGKNWLYSAHDW
jgi:hypothetical protein